jgi:undecaprenyl-diphosphatase
VPAGVAANRSATDAAGPGGSQTRTTTADGTRGGSRAGDLDDGLPSTGDDAQADARLARLRLRDAVFIGASQSLALLPGISRSGISMVAGLFRGLSHEDAARFSFLLATPVILAAGVLKLPDLFGTLGDGVRGQVLAGSVASFVAAYISVRWLTRWFRTRTLTPFAIYCLIVGALSLVVLTVAR